MDILPHLPKNADSVGSCGLAEVWTTNLSQVGGEWIKAWWSDVMLSKWYVYISMYVCMFVCVSMSVLEGWSREFLTKIPKMIWHYYENEGVAQAKLADET